MTAQLYSSASKKQRHVPSCLPHWITGIAQGESGSKGGKRERQSLLGDGRGHTEEVFLGKMGSAG